MVKEKNEDPQCYGHPFDHCVKNNDCHNNNQYCAPKENTTYLAVYNTAFRTCYEGKRISRRL